jgi:hypothetical protein
MKPRRGPIETFSVAVDASTKAVVKAGNLSARISAFGREAEKRDAMHWLIQDAGGSVLTAELRAASEFHGPQKPRRRAPKGRGGARSPGT